MFRPGLARLCGLWLGFGGLGLHKMSSRAPNEGLGLARPGSGSGHGLGGKIKEPSMATLLTSAALGMVEKQLVHSTILLAL